jgi:hypothetical protein
MLRLLDQTMPQQYAMDRAPRQLDAPLPQQHLQLARSPIRIPLPQPHHRFFHIRRSSIRTRRRPPAAFANPDQALLPIAGQP